MNDFLEILNRIITKASNLFVDSSKKEIYQLLTLHNNLSNEELKELARKALSGDLILDNEKKKFSIYSYIKTSFTPNEISYKTNYLISIGVEAFKRAPADLKGTELFPHQIAAAVALTQRCVIQMDTGEGKTYAILPAAFSLACKYGQVYIVCTNSYLAHRDASRTKEYWDFLSLDVGLGFESSKMENWRCPIIYTTINDLIGKYNKDLLREIKPKIKVNFNAIIIDEVDTVLIDDAGRRFCVIQGIKSELFDWSETLLFIDTLLEDEDVVVDRINLTSNLTENGVLKIQEWLKEKKLPVNFINTQQLRSASEVAYIAKNIAEENQHFIEKEGSLYAVDLVTGKVNYSTIPSWLIPLEYFRKKKTRNEQIDRTSLDYIVFIKKFDHLSGTSGSVQDDTMEYFFAYWLPVIIIKPRKKRYKGLQQELVYKTKREARIALLNKAIESVNTGNPVLIGTQNIDDAEELHTLLEANNNLPKTIKINLITAKNEHQIAESFLTSGNVGTITIATQLAGRGVDIRLSKEALDNGGLHLFGLERAREMRFDRQFLGRAGRQGEPFKAVFFISLEDDLMRLFGSERVANMMEFMGLEEGEVIQHSMMSNSIIRAQLKIRKNNFYIRRTKDLQYDVNAEIHERFTKLINYLQSPSSNSNFYSNSFLNHVINSFTNINFGYLKESLKVLPYDKAKQVADSINQLISTSEKIVKIIDFEGREERLVFEKISTILNQKINEKTEVYFDLKERSETLLENYLSDLNFLDLHYYNLRKYRNELNEFEDTDEQKHDSNWNNELAFLFNEFIILEKTDWENIKEILEKIKSKLNKNIENDYQFFLNPITRDKLEESLSKIMDIAKFHQEENREDIIKSLKICKRYPRRISYWGIYQKWMNFINYKVPRIRKTSDIQSSNGIEFQRLFSEKLLDIWDEEEKNIISFILFNLLQADSPENLDELFFYEDNEVSLNERFDPSMKLASDWDLKLVTNDKSPKATYDPSRSDKNVVNIFINQIEEKEIGIDYSKNILTFALENFVRLSPINSMDSPSSILKSINKYYEWESTTVGIATRYKKKHHKWLKKFLIYLNKRGLIGGLPTIGIKAKSTIKRFLKNVKDAKTIVQIGQLLFFLTAFILLSKIGEWGDSKNLSGIWLHLDNLISGGFLNKGIITSPIFLSLIISNFVIKFKFEKILNWIISSILIWWVLDWNLSQITAPENVLSISTFLIIFWLSNFGRILCENIYKLYNISILGAWLFYCSLFVFIPSLYSNSYVVLGIISSLGLQYYWRYKYNYIEFSLASNVQTSSTSSMTFETVTSRRKIEGFTGAIQHFYAIIGAFIGHILLQFTANLLDHELNSILLLLVPTLVYVIISVSITTNLINNLFSEKRWKKKLSKSGESIVETNGSGQIIKHESINTLINKNKKEIIYKSIFLQLLILGIFVLSLKSKYLGQTHFPLFLVYTFITFFVFVLGSELVQKIYKTFFIRLPINYEPIELHEIPEPELDDSLLNRIKQILEPGSTIASVLKVIYIIFIVLYFSYQIYFQIFPVK